MGKRSRNTGNREERHLASLLPGARKISRSGHTGPDISWRGRDIEAKYRGDGFRLLYRWLRDVQILAVRCAREAWLLVMPVHVLLDLLDEAKEEGRREECWCDHEPMTEDVKAYAVAQDGELVAALNARARAIKAKAKADAIEITDSFTLALSLEAEAEAQALHSEAVAARLSALDWPDDECAT